jgi:hypothetical protein
MSQSQKHRGGEGPLARLAVAVHQLYRRVTYGLLAPCDICGTAIDEGWLCYEVCPSLAEGDHVVVRWCCRACSLEFDAPGRDIALEEWWPVDDNDVSLPAKCVWRQNA